MNLEVHDRLHKNLQDGKIKQKESAEDEPIGQRKVDTKVAAASTSTAANS
jgi:hypothetical protein